jgi:hypothetical protein
MLEIAGKSNAIMPSFRVWNVLGYSQTMKSECEVYKADQHSSLVGTTVFSSLCR